LNPENECFWQRPKLGVSENQTVWYDNMPVGQNTLGAKMKTLSQELELSKMYTNHCLRATTITLLDEDTPSLGLCQKHLFLGFKTARYFWSVAIGKSL
jgi:hypothetical protein